MSIKWKCRVIALERVGREEERHERAQAGEPDTGEREKGERRAD